MSDFPSSQESIEILFFFLLQSYLSLQRRCTNIVIKIDNYIWRVLLNKLQLIHEGTVDKGTHCVGSGDLNLALYELGTQIGTLAYFQYNAYFFKCLQWSHQEVE